MHELFLLQALELAQTRRGFCYPNPAVGAILVKDGKIIAQGVHEAAGDPHAEAVALDHAHGKTKGATLYVSLEPCNHWGKTPPCTDRIIAAGIKNVYFAYHDPNPIVANKTTNLLKQAGINCEYLAIPDVEEFYRSYSHWIKTGLPFVTFKIATSLDGKIAAGDGSPIMISGTQCQEFTHQCRKNSDIILTTSHTLRADNPQLNVRLTQETLAKPLAVLASDGELPTNLQVLTTAKFIIVFHDKHRTPVRKLPNVEYIGVDGAKSELNIKQVLHELGSAGYHDVWVEAGSKCLSNFLQHRALNRLYIYIGAQILGREALPLSIEQKIKLDDHAQVVWKIFEQDAVCRIDFCKLS